MADDQLIDQGEIERLLNEGKSAAVPVPPQPPVPEQPAPGDAAGAALDQEEIESMLGEGGKTPAGAEQSPAAKAGTATATPPAEPGPPPPVKTVSEDDGQLLKQEGVEELLQQAGTARLQPASQPPPPKQAASDSFIGEGDVPQGDVDYLLRQAEKALESINSADAADLPEGVSEFRLEEFSGTPASSENATFDLIRDVELDLKIELGRTHMYLEDVLRLRKGSVVPLDKLAGDPVDIYVNGRLIARGEVLVLSDSFCVRIAELIAGTTVSA